MKYHIAIYSLVALCLSCTPLYSYSNLEQQGILRIPLSFQNSKHGEEESGSILASNEAESSYSRRGFGKRTAAALAWVFSVTTLSPLRAAAITVNMQAQAAGNGQELENIDDLVRRMGYPADSNIAALFKSDDVKGLTAAFSRRYSLIDRSDRDKFEAELIKICEELVIRIGHGDLSEAIGNIFRALVSDLEMQDDIFERIKAVDVSGDTAQIENSLTDCVTKAQFLYIFLRLIGLRDVNEAISFDHAGITIPVGNNRFLLANLGLNLFRVIELSSSNASPYFSVTDNLWVLKQKDSSEDLDRIRAEYKQGGTWINEKLQYLPDKTILSLFFPVLYMPSQSGRQRDALKACTADMFNDRGMAYKILGELCEKKGNTGEKDAMNFYKKAEREFLKGIWVDPGYAALYDNLGLLYIQQLGKTSEGIGLIKAAIRHNPLNPATHNNLGIALIAEKDWIGAEAALTKAIELDPSRGDSHGNLGDMYLQMGNSERNLHIAQDFYLKAIKEYKLAEKFSPKDFSIHHGLGLAYYALERYEECIVEFEKAVKLDPSSWYTYLELGLIYYNLKRDYTKAIRSFERAIKLNPNLYEAHFSLGWVYFKQGNRKKAIDSWAMAYLLRNDIRLDELPEDMGDRVKQRVSDPEFSGKLSLVNGKIDMFLPLGMKMISYSL
jgi:tetratricopeptide (TPR) repeat protein